MPRKVLFLCTANSARSILAEAILAARGGSRFTAFSAGSQPRGVPNPRALELLAGKGLDVSGLASKSWDVFAGPSAPVLDLVITVCDNARGEVCPIFPGHPAQAHWGIPDPAGHGTDGALADFETAYQRLAARIEALMALDEDAMDARAWRDAVMEIGKISEGATRGAV